MTSDEDQALIRSRLLDRMVGEILLLDAAAEAGITADPADVDAQYAESASQFETEQAFLDRLAELHLDAAQFRENIEENIIMDSYVDHYVSNIVPDEELTPTEEELRALYDEAIKEFVGAVPSYEDMLPSLDNELRRRKVGEAIDQLFEDLQAAADIEIYG